MRYGRKGARRVMGLSVGRIAFVASLRAEVDLRLDRPMSRTERDRQHLVGSDRREHEAGRDQGTYHDRQQGQRRERLAEA